MLEWYEAYADYRDTMARIEELVARVAQEAIGGTKVTFSGHEIDLAPPWKRVSFADALGRARALDRATRTSSRPRSTSAASTRTLDKTWAQLVDHALSATSSSRG